jgi:hypothetical protein
MPTILPPTHLTADSAYVVEDYPYGYRLRCRIRYWLDVHPKHGARFMSQTTNPKKGNVWNKPKASTYSRFAAAMFLDDAGHCHHAGAHEYMGTDDLVAWRDTYGEGVPESMRKYLNGMIAAKLAYDANRTSDDKLSVGLPEARAAFVAAIKGEN